MAWKKPEGYHYPAEEAYMIAHREKRLARAKEWNKNNPEKVRVRSKKYLASFSLTHAVWTEHGQWDFDRLVEGLKRLDSVQC